jgi:hypothetical protein
MFGIPPFFKEIFEHLPNNLSDLISWREMLGEVTSLSNRMITKNGVTMAMAEIKPILGNNIEIVEELPNASLSLADGERILKLYFLQIMKLQKMFLDLRPKRFSGNDDKLLWEPNGLWGELDPYFSEGIRMVYLGYYKNDDDLFAKGLEKSRLVNSEWSQQKQQEVIAVFTTHFSNGRGERIAFTMEGFQKSFTEIFKTLVKNKIKLDKNFLYLGIMLVTLYASLSEIGGEFDVSEIFKQVDK